MPRRPAHEEDGGAEDNLRLCGADLRMIRRRAAEDLIDDRDPLRVIRILDAVYWNGYRAGLARRVRAARGGQA